MSESALARSVCVHCATPLEFPFESAHAVVPCPVCQKETELIPETPAEARTPQELSVESEAPPDGAFAIQGTIPRAGVSVFYQLGLLIVTVAMAILPLIYLALIGAAGFAVYYWATNFTGMLHTSGGIKVRLFMMACYVAPLFAGMVLVLFMIKPLFARRPPHAQPLAVNPDVDAKLYAFVKQVCKTVGAPMPRRIDIDCNLNASASFRRGFLSFLGKDLVLTIGLPLVAGMNVRQFGGVVAHEFGHFTQGFGMRLAYTIRRINAWFARVAYERDAWDMMLEDWAEEAEDWRISLVVNFARFAVWCSRLVLKLLMYVGHGIGCFMLRQMEYDADHYQICMAGSEAFEGTFRRLHVLGNTLGVAHKDMRTSFNVGRRLPDDFPAYMMRHEHAVTPKNRTEWENEMGLEPSGIFDTHPSHGDRIRRARIAAAPGIIQLETPATELFANFCVVSKQVTMLHYSDDLGIPRGAATLAPDMGPET